MVGWSMISVTRLNHSAIVLNSDLIEHIESTPDTVISLTTGERILVLESPEEVVDRIIGFRRRILNPGCTFGEVTPSGEANGRK